MDKTEFGKKIKELRLQKGFSQEELADLCKMSVRSIQRIEAGKVKPHLYTVRVLSEVLEYKIECENASDEKDSALKESFPIGAACENLKDTLFRLWDKKGEAAMEIKKTFQNLAKSRTDKKIAGVCGGLGEHTGIPSWFWRILFLVVSVIYGFGAVMYILLWIFMPKPKAEPDIVIELKNTWLNRFSLSVADKKIAGVCGGLGEVSQVPSWIWRVVFIAFTPLYGSGLIMYIALWVFAPRHKAVNPA